MSEISYQCWICPQCNDDRNHKPGDAHCVSQMAAEDRRMQDLKSRISAARENMERVTGTSASDCKIQMELHAINRPANALSDIAQVLLLMNFDNVEKKAHRAALLQAGKKALAMLGTYHG